MPHGLSQLGVVEWGLTRSHIWVWVLVQCWVAGWPQTYQLSSFCLSFFVWEIYRTIPNLAMTYPSTWPLAIWKQRQSHWSLWSNSMSPAEHLNELRKYLQNWCLEEEKDEGRNDSRIQEKWETQNYLFPFSSVFSWPKRQRIAAMFVSGSRAGDVCASPWNSREAQRFWKSINLSAPPPYCPSWNADRDACQWMMFARY